MKHAQSNSSALTNSMHMHLAYRFENSVFKNALSDEFDQEQN